MHWSAFLLPAAAAAEVLEKRQAGGAPVAEVVELKAQFRKGARRTLTKIGRTCFWLRGSS
jgi:hypothetical protein